jgi:alkylhydroperoxidase family enzyme
MRVTVSPDQIHAAFDAIKDDPSFDESRELWKRGRPPVEMIQAMCARPEILRAFAGFGSCVYPGGLLSRREKELVIITSSQRNDCQFCTSSHCDLVSLSDIVAEPLAAIEVPDDLSERERLAIAFTKAAMADSNRIPESVWADVRSAFSEPEIVELAFLIGFINMLNLFNNILEVRYHGEYRVFAGATS